MSWTTVCDLRMDAYQGDRVLDASDHHNDATAQGQVQTGQGFVRFQGLDARLEVPVRDESLGRFAGLRIQALVRPGPISRRFNLVEGWMSFALVIQDDGRLIATIYDGQSWVGPDSGATRVQPNAWSRVAFEYDGVSAGWLTLNGATVGTRFDMPVGIRQPQQVIALGHWPRGDGRYTLDGDLGHVRIERRDYEDHALDVVRTAFCRRRLSPEQADALREIRHLVSAMAPEEQQRVVACARDKSERMRRFLHALRAWEPREVARLRLLADRLRAAWCCTFDLPAAYAALLEYFRAIAGSPGSPERARFRAALDEFFDISAMCSWPGPPYDRVRELAASLFPELSDFEADLRLIADRL